jgi:hypothetical protein
MVTKLRGPYNIVDAVMPDGLTKCFLSLIIYRSTLPNTFYLTLCYVNSVFGKKLPPAK